MWRFVLLLMSKSCLTNRVERSSDQIIKPVNLAALTKWVGNIPEDVVREMADIAPMLSVLGYDPYANPPVYGAPDSLVSDNTRRYVPICYAAWLLQLLHIVLLTSDVYSNALPWIRIKLKLDEIILTYCIQSETDITVESSN